MEKAARLFEAMPLLIRKKPTRSSPTEAAFLLNPNRPYTDWTPRKNRLPSERRFFAQVRIRSCIFTVFFITIHAKLVVIFNFVLR
jgi:hypothetical protein